MENGKNIEFNYLHSLQSLVQREHVANWEGTQEW